MGMNIRGRNFMCLEDFTPDEIRYLLDLAHTLKAEKRAGMDQRRLFGKNLLMLFDLSSTRTRCAFETSACDLGMGTTYLSNSHFGTKETIKDSMRVFSAMYDAIIYRGPSHAQLMKMAEHCAIPLINGLTDHEHPTQMLADIMTLEEIWGKGDLKNKTLCYVGRGGDICAYSYGVACAMTGMNFKYITSFMTLDEALEQLNSEELAAFREIVPEGSHLYGWTDIMDPVKRSMVEELYAKYSPNASFTVTDDLDQVKGADVITTENWGFFTSPVATWLPGIKKYRPYQVNRQLMDRTGNPNAIVLHMLPATHNCEHTAGQELVNSIKDKDLAQFLSHGLEVTDEIFEENASYIFREAENRQHTIKAVLQAVVGA